MIQFIYKTKISFLLLLGCITIISCDKDLEFREPLGSGGAAPGAIEEVTVENLSGKAKISYVLPDDDNLLYVKAVYTLSNGKKMEVKSSYYSNSLVVEGFADTEEHSVELFTVNRNNMASEPTQVTVKPLEAPLWKVKKSIEMNNAFGGYNLNAENPDTTDISIFIMKRNVFNEFEVDNHKSIFTSVQDITSKIRGLDTLNYEFKYFVQDKWGNSTDTVDIIIKPLYEAELISSNFKPFVLPGDAVQVTNGARLEYAWDGRLGWPYTSFTDQVPGGPDPHKITFDTGVLARLSRIWIRPYPEHNPPQYYILSTMKRFEIYGSANPSLNGELDESWILLGSYEVVKPSGSPVGQDTAEDRETAAAGFSWELDINAPAVRYIRIVCLENFAGGTAQSINELKVFGDTRL